MAARLTCRFEAGMFDAATLIHVGMNIQDKARRFEEARRVLKPGARFCA
jgi:ubiquinone/menaquinone biosynthesis C-methylase UbiE